MKLLSSQGMDRVTRVQILDKPVFRIALIPLVKVRIL